jgi:uncharacterized protein (UPF0332 family)
MTPLATPAFDWAEYLRLATDLSQNPDEASQRTSMSRAYYSIYHAATIRAQQNGYTGKKHQELWALFQRDSDRACRKLSTLGNSMKVAREEADYKTTVLDVADQMVQQLEWANDFIGRLGELPPTSPKA